MSKKKERHDTHNKGGGIDRRKFIEGVGMAAAATTLGGLKAGQALAAEESAAVSMRARVLQDSPIVMLWRRVTDLKETRRFVDTNLRMPLIGQDQISVIYDAGIVMVGYAIQDDAVQKVAAGSACSIESPLAVPLQNNPASAMVMAPLDFDNSVRIVFAGRGKTPLFRTEIGETLSFMDDDGNYSAFYHPYTFAYKGKAGEKLAALMRNRTKPAIVPASLDNKRVQHPNIPNPVVSFELMVSDLAKSRKFYADVLGLEPLSTGSHEAKFDSGSLILTLKSEPSNMLVRFLKRTGRLRADWIVFHVNDIKAKTRALKERGVHFPHGIETSEVGHVAYFNDPDGYSFNLWQPSGKPKGIDLYPVLRRILKETAKSPA
jgi:predicted enzyme related to lactoylglutathione lyase